MTTPNPYWVNRHDPHYYLNYLETLYSNGLGVNNTAPVFLLSADDADTLAARISSRYYTGSPTSLFTDRSDNYCPNTHFAAPDTMSITDDGLMHLNWNPANNETLYPCVDGSSTLPRNGKMQSFAVWISELRAKNWNRYRLQNMFRKSHEDGAQSVNVWLVGTVGDKGSGADLELEDVANWRIGRPLYLPGNALTIPFKFLPNLTRTAEPAAPVLRLVKTGTGTGNVALIGTNGLSTGSYSDSLSSEADRAFNGWNGSVKINDAAGEVTEPGGWVITHNRVLTTDDNSARSLPALPDTGEFTIDLKLPDDATPHNTVSGFWGPNADQLSLGVYRDGYSGDAYIFEDRDSFRYRSDTPVPAGAMLKYVFTGGDTCKVYVNGELKVTAPVGGTGTLSLQDFTTIGHPDYDIAGRRAIEYVHVEDGSATEVPTAINEWLGVDFGQLVPSVSGFRVVVDADVPLDQLAKDVVVQVSTDGTTFADHQSVVLAQLHDQTVTLDTAVDAQAVRLKVVTNHGSPLRTQLNELEIHTAVPASAPMQVSGAYGNIALVGTNGLTPASFSASNSYHLDTAAGAFDGYAYSARINQQSTAYGKQARGIWLSGWQDGNHENQWLQVDFGDPVGNITGFSLRIHDPDHTMFPKDVIVQLSDDGETFTNHEALTVPAEGRFRRVTLTTPATARYFRLFITNNYGSTDATKVEEFEIYRG